MGDVTKTHELWRADGIDAGYRLAAAARRPAVRDEQ